MTKLGVAALVILLASQTVLAVQPDKAGCTDHPLFPSRMPNYYIESCETKEFDSYLFATSKPPKRAVEGRSSTSPTP